MNLNFQWPYWGFAPSLAKCEAQARSVQRACSFARINWKAHVQPIVLEGVELLAARLKRIGMDQPYHEVLGARRELPWEPSPDNEIFLNSITVSFGARPLPLRAVIKVPGRLRVASERRAAMVFSQLGSGGVVVAYYPPESELAKPKREYYLGAVHNDPVDLTRASVEDLLVLLFQLDYSASVATLRRGIGARLMRKLERRDNSIRHGARWKLLGKALAPALKLAGSAYGAAHGVPPHP